MLGWAGLRGAVPVVLATFPVIEGVPHSLEFFNIVFFAVLLSTLVQGATFEPLARRLGVTTSRIPLGPGPPPRPARSSALVTTSGPWTTLTGTRPTRRVDRIETFVRQFRTRLDRPGALVELGRRALRVHGAGAGDRLGERCRRWPAGDLDAPSTDPEREWWREVIGALAR